MCVALSVGFLKFSIIIASVFSQNNFISPFLEKHISSSMDEIYFAALYPDTVALNSNSVELVDAVAYKLLL